MRVAGLVILSLAACKSSGHNDAAPTPTLPSSSADRAAALTGPVEFSTEPPQRLDSFSALPLSFAEDYRKSIIALEGRIVPIQVEPADLRQPALYGFNVIIDGGNRSFIVDGDEQLGYRLFVDLDGDGDLQEEEPRHFIANNGPPTVVLEPTLVFQIRAPQPRDPLPFSVWKSDQTLRRGTAKLEDR